MYSISSYIEEYITNFNKIRKLEGYKWKFLKTFKDNFDIEAHDFHGMLSKALADDVNLLVANNGSYQYLPKGTLLIFAEHYPEDVREMFRGLIMNDDIVVRIERFMQNSDELIKKCNANGFLEHDRHHQDRHAISVYLSALFPELFYIYKYKIYKLFLEKTQYNYELKMGDKGILYFYRLCNEIREIILENNELLQLHNKWLIDNDYVGVDPANHLLAQDFIYSAAVHLRAEVQQEVAEPIMPSVSIINASLLQVKNKRKHNFKGLKDNSYFENVDKKTLGNLGEAFVLDFEKRSLIACGKQNLAKKVKNVAVEEGDGTGYDILSYLPNGKRKYIEVKTTSGPLNTQFFVTQTELSRSIQEKDKYYLYRVYDFDRITKTGKIKIIRGDLSNICQVPTNYSVKLKSDD